MKRYRMICRLHLGDVLLQTAVWTVVTVITFGLALPFFAYSFVRLIINHTELQEIPT